MDIHVLSFHIFLLDSSIPSSRRKTSYPDEELWELEQAKNTLQGEAERLREERDTLIEELNAEHRLLVDIQQVADEELDLLRRQVNALQMQKKSRETVSYLGFNKLNETVNYFS